MCVCVHVLISKLFLLIDDLDFFLHPLMCFDFMDKMVRPKTSSPLSSDYAQINHAIEMMVATLHQ